jgi:hypothetical protein
VRDRVTAREGRAKRLAVPLVLTVSVAAAAAIATTVAATSGCGDNKPDPMVDAGPPDTPIV